MCCRVTFSYLVLLLHTLEMLSNELINSTIIYIFRCDNNQHCQLSILDLLLYTVNKETVNCSNKLTAIKVQITSLGKKHNGFWFRTIITTLKSSLVHTHKSNSVAVPQN